MNFLECFSNSNQDNITTFGLIAFYQVTIIQDGRSSINFRNIHSLFLVRNSITGLSNSFYIVGHIKATLGQTSETT